jgi:Txe/YoeB family toxin of Txe-Axe toxin-antitoxin module
MENGYNILWTPNSLEELEQTIEYLQFHFTDKEIKKLVQKIESLIEIISQNPFIFPISESKNIHKLVILEFNTMYYRVNNGSKEILSFFSNR